MIMPWNRKDVFSSNQMDKLYNVRSLLSGHGIKYGYRSAHGGAGMARGLGGAGYNPNAEMYIVYVHKNDYDEAMHIIHSQK